MAYNVDDVCSMIQPENNQDVLDVLAGNGCFLFRTKMQVKNK